MNMIQMKYFITAAKCLNFTKAADKLFITQPALSRQIASMEAELNMQLFIRNNRSVRLTRQQWCFWKDLKRFIMNIM